MQSMPSQGGGSSLRSIFPASRIHPFKSKWMKPHGLGVAADVAYRDISRLQGPMVVHPTSASFQSNRDKLRYVGVFLPIRSTHEVCVVIANLR